MLKKKQTRVSLKWAFTNLMEIWCGFSRNHEKSSRLRYQVECSGVLLHCTCCKPLSHGGLCAYHICQEGSFSLCPHTNVCLMYAPKAFNWDGVCSHPALPVSSLYYAREQCNRGKQSSEHAGDAHTFQTGLEAGFAELLQTRRCRITCCWYCWSALTAK